MIRNSVVLIIISIFIGVCTASLSVYFYNDAIREHYTFDYITTKEDAFEHYIQDIQASFQGTIKSHAYWSEARNHLLLKDDEWLALNATSYLVEEQLYGIEYMMVATENLDFIQEAGGAYSNDLLAMPQIREVLDDNQELLFFVEFNDSYAIIGAGPYRTNAEEEPTGIFLIMNLIDDDEDEALLHLLGSEYIGSEVLNKGETMNDQVVMDKAIAYVPLLDSNYNMALIFDLSETYAIFRDDRNFAIYVIVIVASVVAVMVVTILTVIQNITKRTIGDIEQIAKGNFNTSIKKLESKSKLINLDILIDSIETMTQDMRKHIMTIDKNYLELVEVMVKAVEINDAYTSKHNIEVGNYALIIANEIGYRDSENIVMGAKLHDVGKISIPTEILNKPGKLTAEEYEIIKTHPVEGYNIIKNVDYFDEIKYGIKHHHEHWDGSGYPDGLIGDEIPLLAQIISIADVYDALTSDRAYRTGVSHEEAFEYIVSQSGVLFNPLIVQAFIERSSDIKMMLHRRKCEVV